MSLHKFEIAKLTEIPFGFPGRVFRSPLPFGIYDLKGEMVNIYRREKISTIVMLISEIDCHEITGFDLRGYYHDLGFEVLNLPIADFGLPQDGLVEQVLQDVLVKVYQGENVVVHCHAGIGRTGMFLACLAKRVFKFDGEQAIRWVRQSIPTALETSAQEQFVMSF